MDLIAELEYIIGQCCYNSNIKNFSGDTELDDGRWFRYPLTVELNGKKEKWRRKLKASLTTPDKFAKAHYGSGANEIHIVYGIMCAIEYLEKNYGLQIPESPTKKSSLPADWRKQLKEKVKAIEARSIPDL